jgi:hypothetical protein
MQDDTRHLQLPPPVPRKIRMVGCRIVGLRFRGFIGHSTRDMVGDPTYRELSCDTLCETSSEAMITARELLRILALKYGFQAG